MKVLFILTYYRPHTSGLTVYVQRLAEGLAARGVEATIATSLYDPALDRQEIVNGVHVVRIPVLRRVGKGVVMPGFAGAVAGLAAKSDLVSLHLPQFEAPVAAFLARRAGRPVVLTYHCDLLLPRGALNRLTQWAAWRMHFLAGRLADRIVAYTADYARNSPFLRRFAAKVEVIAPPVDLPPPLDSDVRAFEQAHGLNGSRRIGVAARLASEKGIEVLLAALPAVWRRWPNARVLFAGPHADLVGERDYARRLAPAIAAAGDRWTFLGTLPPAEMATFFAACDVTVLPSVNATESFGLVQVESMLAGAPVVASSLPGVRVPIQTTGMGELVPPRNAPALAAAILAVLDRPDAYRRPRSEIEAHFSTARTCDAYQAMFGRLLQ